MRTRHISSKIYWIAGTGLSKDYSPLDIILRKGEILVLTGQWDKAELLFGRGLGESQRMSSLPGQATCRYQLGEVQRLKGDYRQSMENLKQAAQLFHDNNDPASRAMATGAMGGVYGEQGDYQKAVECLMERKAWAESTGNKMEQETVWGNLGVMYAEQRMLDKALGCYQKQRALAEELGDQLAVSFAVGNTGNIHLFKGEYDQAVDCFQKQIEISARIGDKRSQCAGTCSLGLVHKRLGRLEEALECFEKAIKISSEIGFTRVLSVTAGNIGTVYQYLGLWEKARHFLEKQKKLTEELDDRPGQVTALANLSKLEDILGNPEKARFLLHSASKTARENRLTGLLNILLNMLGELLLEQKALAEASDAIQEAMALARERDDHEQLAMAGMLSLMLRVEQGEILAIHELEDLAGSETEEAIKLTAYQGLFRHTGQAEHLKKAEILSDKLYRQTRDIELKIKMEKLKAEKQ